MKGFINVVGKINSRDKTYELNLLGEHIQPSIASFLLERPSKNEFNSQETQEEVSSQDELPSLKLLGGDISFEISSRGNLQSPVIAVDLKAKDIIIPVISAKINRT